MATATLELVNPYSKLGLKRRPTYNEIINLIDENETITGNLPDRTATFYKASPEGSFFDGTDAMELLKEQQNRIFQRQMQDLLLRQNVRNNGGTFNMERARQSSSSSDTSSSTPISLGEDRGTLSVGLQADLQRRQQQLRDRQQQTGQAHSQELSGQSRLPTLDSFLSGMTSPLRRMIQPLPIPARQPETIDLTRDEDMEAEAEEDFFPEEMTTAREEPKSKTKLMEKISYSTNISRWSEKELEFQLFIRGTDPRDPEISLEGLRKKGRGKGLTNRQHLNNLAQEMINDGRWQRRVEEELLKKRISEYKQSQRPRGSRD